MGEIFHSRPWITTEDKVAVQDVLASGLLAQGATLVQFETEMSRWLGSAGAVGVGSGGAALELALRALGCGPEDEVILPTYVCRTVLDAIVATGSRPVLCDVGPDWVVQAENIVPYLTPRTRALVVPHLYGLYADLPAIRQLGLPIIEDAAQAIGSTPQHANQGDLVVLSFHPTKCLTTGEGGMVLARDPDLVVKCRRGRDASERSFGRQFAPLSDMAAALGLSQLARYSEFLRRRKAIARRYQEALHGLSGLDFDFLGRHEAMFFRFPFHRPGGLEGCQSEFARRAVHVRRGVDLLLHRQSGLPDTSFSQACAHFSDTISLPIYPALTDMELSAVIEAAIEIFSAHG